MITFTKLQHGILTTITRKVCSTILYPMGKQCNMNPTFFLLLLLLVMVTCRDANESSRAEHLRVRARARARLK